MAQRCISNESLCTTGFHYTLSLIPILDNLCQSGDDHRL